MSDEPASRWYHQDLSRFRDALMFSEAESGFSSRLIEKDYFCSLLLHDLSGLFQQGLVFKGGTCLSKVHAEFFRLSEDLDFSLPLRPDATRSERRNSASPIKDHFAGMTTRLPWFEEAEALAAHNESRQYIGQFAYRSAVTGEREFIKVEVLLREENRLPTEILPARTLLRDPHSGRPALGLVNVCVLRIQEAYAEKIRAALTRREPTIRDFFDLDHAVRRTLFDHRNPEVLGLVAAKLSVAGNKPVDLSDAKVEMLRGQVEAHLRPVLRTSDYEAFDLRRVVSTLEELVRQLEELPD
jgi:predicted nucleotidyltransferase component of viral defense system